MAKKKLSKGIHFVKMKNCQDKTCIRKVQVNAKGQWQFLKMSKSKKR
ncbi:MAG: hypothetical protein K8Q89_00220 [Nitrosarchaeum sp.]|nr:hypothetical protein [Nitrosarchaeum sp.]